MGWPITGCYIPCHQSGHGDTSQGIVVMAVALTGFFGRYFNTSGLFAIENRYKEEEHVSISSFSLMVSCGVCAEVVSNIVLGSLSDRWGPRIVFLLTVYLLAASSICFVLLPHKPIWFALGEFFLAGTWPAVVVLVSRWTPPQYTGRVLAFMSLGYLFGDVLVRAVMGLLVSETGFVWGSLYLIATGINIVFNVPALFLLVEPRISQGEGTETARLVEAETDATLSKAPRSIDRAVEVIAGGDDSDENEPLVCTPRMGGATSADEHPTRMWQLLARRDVYHIFGMAFASFALRDFFFIYGSQLLVNTYCHNQGNDCRESDMADALGSWGSMVFPLMGLVSAPVTGTLLDITRRRWWSLIMASTYACVWVLLYTFNAYGFHGYRIASALLMGLGVFVLSSFSQCAGKISVDSAGAHLAGTLSGITNACGEFGGFLTALLIARLHGDWRAAIRFLMWITAFGCVCAVTWNPHTYRTGHPRHKTLATDNL